MIKYNFFIFILLNITSFNFACENQTPYISLKSILPYAIQVIGTKKTLALLNANQTTLSENEIKKINVLKLAHSLDCYIPDTVPHIKKYLMTELKNKHAGSYIFDKKYWNSSLENYTPCYTYGTTTIFNPSDPTRILIKDTTKRDRILKIEQSHSPLEHKDLYSGRIYKYAEPTFKMTHFVYNPTINLFVSVEKNNLVHGTIFIKFWNINKPEGKEFYKQYTFKNYIPNGPLGWSGYNEVTNIFIEDNDIIKVYSSEGLLYIFKPAFKYHNIIDGPLIDIVKTFHLNDINDSSHNKNDVNCTLF